jgi:nitrate reductase delta subunit
MMKPIASATAADPAAQDGAPPVDALVAVYRIISEWLLYPEEMDPATMSDEALRDALADAELIDPALGPQLRTFHDGYPAVTVEDYLALLELNPRCPLYMGSYQFADPTTCASAGVSDRNQYMLEIGNVYKHFGLEIGPELPDFLPAMIEFLALSAGAEGDDAALRLRFIERMVWPGVRLFARKLQTEEAPYKHLAEALTLCLRAEAGDMPEPDDKGPAPRGQSELIQIEGVAKS